MMILFVTPFVVFAVGGEIDLVGPGLLIGFVGIPVAQLVAVARRGQSFGKLVMGLRVVKLDGTKASVARVLLLRNLVPYMLSAIPFFGVIDVFMLFGEERLTLHDHVAGTMVVDTHERLWRRRSHPH
jgi:uncharacterized RDD family membrane protein YckC